MSHAWNGELLCSMRMMVVNGALMVRSLAGVDVRKPMRPVLST